MKASRPIGGCSAGTHPEQDAEVDRLVSALQEGQLTHADRQRLEQLLEQPRARVRYRKLAMLHASLLYLWHHAAADQPQLAGRSGNPHGGSGHGGGRIGSAPAASVTVVGQLVIMWFRRLSRPTPFSLTVAGLVVGLVLAVAAILPLATSPGQGAADGGSRPAAAVAVVAAVHDVAWASAGSFGAGLSGAGSSAESGPLPGAALPLDSRLRLARGFVEIAFASGARLVVEGPADVVITGRDSARLDRGRLVVRTTHGPRGGSTTPLFTVATPRGFIDDLGTEFGVEVPAQGSEAVHVFEGVVSVSVGGDTADSRRPDAKLSGHRGGLPDRRDPDGERPRDVRLEAGGSVAIDADHSIRTIAVRTQRQFVRTLPDTGTLRACGLAQATGQPKPRRSAAWHGENVEEFDPVKARFVRFTIFETSSGQPCLDELEVFATDGRNVAREGTATASGTLPGYATHAIAHVNDGLYGNDHSWIGDMPRGWIQIELPAEAEIVRIVWSRDRTPSAKYVDRVPVKYVVSLSLDGRLWQHVAHGSDRLPFGSPRPAPEPEEPPIQ